MKKRTNLLAALFAATGMMALILDSKAALQGAQEGVKLCIQTLIPSLFPFFFLSNILSASMMGRRLRLLKPIGRLCRIPEGSEYILLCGFLGGYPVGGQCIGDGLNARILSKQDARRMLPFCNNCGPAFLFGITSYLFERWYVSWFLLFIQMLSAIAAGMILPGGGGNCIPEKKREVSVIESLQHAIRSITAVCGWIIIFKTFLTFLHRWVMWYFPTEIQVITSGILELSNGCISLTSIPDVRVRFILCAGFLSFGGFCVAMQSFFAAGSSDKQLYFPGKVLQCSIAMTLASLGCGWQLWYIPAIIALCLSLFLQKNRKTCRNLQPVDV